MCAERVPDLFQMVDDGLAYVKEVSWPGLCVSGDGEPTYMMADGQAGVPKSLLDDAIVAASG